jgi:ribonuclease HI
VEDQDSAKVEHLSPGLTIFTDGPRVGSGAVGYAVAWQNGQHWLGIKLKVQMRYNGEAFGAECAALTTALEVAARRQTTQESVTSFTDAQAAIR